MPLPNSTLRTRRHLFQLLPLWVFILLFKTSGVLHYTLIAVFGAQVLPLWAVGFATGSTTLLQLLCDVPAGKLIDRLGARATLRIGSTSFLFAAAVLLFGLTPLTFGLTLIFSALGWLFFTPSISAYLLAVTPAPIMGRTTGVRRFAEGIGGMLATIGLASIITLPADVLGAILAYPLIGASLVLWFLWHPKSTSVSAPHHARAKAKASTLRELTHAFRQLSPAAPLLAAWQFAAGFTYGTIWLVVPLAIAGNLLAIPGYSLSIFDGTVLIVSLFIGSLVDRVTNKGQLIRLGLFGSLAALLFLSHSSAIWFPIAAFLMSACDEIVSIGLWSWLDKLDHRHDQDGLVTGAITLADDLGWSLGPIVGSLMLAFTSPEIALLAAGVPILILFIIALALRWQKPNKA